MATIIRLASVYAKRLSPLATILESPDSLNKYLNVLRDGHITTFKYSDADKAKAKKEDLIADLGLLSGLLDE